MGIDYCVLNVGVFFEFPIEKNVTAQELKIGIKTSSAIDHEEQGMLLEENT